MAAAMAMAGFNKEQEEQQLQLPKNGKILNHQQSPATGSPMKKKVELQNGWQEALITEYFENGGATIYIPRLINGWLEQESQNQNQNQILHNQIHQQQQLNPPPAMANNNNNNTKKNSRGKVCILSIDGGGVRGIIPAKVLAHLELLLQMKTGDPKARLVDFFDIVAGTNVGGLIATMLFTGGNNDHGRPLFSAEEACKCIAHNAASMFRRRIERIDESGGQCRNQNKIDAAAAAAASASSSSSSSPKKGFLQRLFSRRRTSSSRKQSPSKGPGSPSSEQPEKDCSVPRYSAEGLENILRNILGPRTLRDTLKPVLVPCYDLATAAPFLFSRAGALESAAWDFRLADVCRAAAATPGLFPPAGVASVDGTTRCTAVDAGMVMNNPAAAAMTHVLHNGEEFPAVGDAGDVLLLSLGCGLFERRYGGVADWGPCQWARPASEIVLDNVSDMVDQMLALAYASCGRDNYLRLQAVMPASEAPAEMDDPSESNLSRLTRMADELLEQRAMEHMGFGGMRASQQTNRERLDWFAEQLIQEQRSRALRSSPTVLLKQQRH